MNSNKGEVSATMFSVKEKMNKLYATVGGRFTACYRQRPLGALVKRPVCSITASIFPAVAFRLLLDCVPSLSPGRLVFGEVGCNWTARSAAAFG